MRSHSLLPTLLVGLGLVLGAPPIPAKEAASAAQINKLIDQMGSGTFSEREKATKQLDAIGVPALEALRKAAKSEDAEIKRRAQELLTKIEKRAESAKVLAGTRIHLVYKDTPVSEAVADLQKKSGYRIHLHDPEEKLKERKVTLDTAETTFWHALGLFCDRAGLVEATVQDLKAPRGGAGGLPIPKPPIRQPAPGTLPALPPPAPAKGLELTVQVAEAPAVPAPPAGPGGRAVMPGRPGVPFMPGTPGLILLKDGKPPKLPTDDSSAVRVRALPGSDRFGPAPEGEVLLVLEVSPEPRLQWQSLQSIHIDKTLDDRGQSLTQIIPQVPAGPGFPGGPPGMLVRAAVRPVALWGGVNPQVPVQFKKGEKAARSLKELKGVLSAQLLSEPKPMITADNLAKAAGKTFKGAEGGSIKILEIKTDEQKNKILRFEFEQPQLDNVVPFVGGVGAEEARRIQLQQQAVQMQVQFGRGGGAPVIRGPINGLAVQDAKGNTLPVQMGQQQFQMLQQPGGGNVVTAIYTLICPPGKDQGEPAKLVYLGRKRLTIDIPFALKDVPLP